MVSRFPALFFRAFPTLLQVIFEDDQEEKDVVSRKVRLCHNMLNQTSQIRVFLFIVLQHYAQVNKFFVVIDPAG